MLRALLLFVAADAFGEAMHLLIHLPMSGSLLGMVLLFALFTGLGAVPAHIAQTGRAMLRLLPVFFVPAGVGAIGHAALIARYWPAILAALAGSSLATLLVTGFALRTLERSDAGVRSALVAPERKS